MVLSLSTIAAFAFSAAAPAPEAQAVVPTDAKFETYGVGGATGCQAQTADTPCEPIDITEDTVSGVHKLYVANYWKGNVVSYKNPDSATPVTNPGTTPSQELTVGANPISLAADSTNHYIYVANEGSGTISVIQNKGTAEDAVIKTIQLTIKPTFIAYDSANSRLYAISSTQNKVQVVTNLKAASPTVAAALSTGTNPVKGVVAGTRFFIANAASNNVTVVNGTSVSAITLPGAVNPFDISYDASSKNAFISNAGSNNVSVIKNADSDTPAYDKNIAVGAIPHGIISASNGYTYVANSGATTVSAFPSNGTSVTPIPLSSSNPEGFAEGKLDKKIYAYDNKNDVVSAIRGDASDGEAINTVAHTWTRGGDPDPAFDTIMSAFGST
ncbi:MAG: YncE family protein, partial [Bifidobacteriaceae bacterium]|nr:YncE family protein [Bifidobacteriaceae bacterium]